MSKYGSSSIWLLVDGYNLISTKLKSVGHKVAAVNEVSAGCGDTTTSKTPTGLSEVMLSQGQAFFDTSAATGHAVLSAPATSPQAVPRIVCSGFAGHTAGVPFVGMDGQFQISYDVLAKMGDLTKANVAYVAGGQLDHGVVLEPLGARTVDWNGTTVDNAASSAGGGVGYLQVTALSGFTGFVGKIQHSTDGSSWADLITFTNVTSAPGKERLTVAGTINRYTRFVGDVTGTGSITVFAGVARL